MIRAFPVTAALLFILSTVVLGADLSDPSIYFGEELDPYERIMADDLLGQIANGEDLRYDRVLIVGDLDLRSLDQPISSEIILTNSKITGVINLDKATLVKKFDVNGSIFLGPASFRCCKFKSGSDFSSCRFFQAVNFGMSRFNDMAKFNSAQFDDIANFGGATFQKGTFSGAKFSDTCRFTDSHFIEDAEFHDGVVFGKYAEFENCTFVDYAFFTEAEFLDDANFIMSNFSRDSHFNNVQFQRTVNFEDAIFQEANFEKASFWEVVSFKNASFGGNASFCSVSFGGEADFRGANFSHNSSFSDADFSEGGRFDEAVFNDNLSLYRTDFTELRIPWVNIKNDHLVYDRDTYFNLMRNYGGLGWFTDFGGCYYQYRDIQRQNRSWRHDGLSKAMDTLAWFYGYGVRPFRAVTFMLSLIALFAVIYESKGGIKRSRNIELRGDSFIFTLKDLGQSRLQILFDSVEEEKKTDIRDALYFSACTFVSRTTGELSPQGICTQIARVERWMGLILFGLLLAYLTNQIYSYFQPPT